MSKKSSFSGSMPMAIVVFNCQLFKGDECVCIYLHAYVCICMYKQEKTRQEGRERVTCPIVVLVIFGTLLIC